ncbi:MAG: ABC transporter ATP-binding protein [Clostridiales bacterium]|nr:ABC transporter ATP-binding protein [Clostridiales bacterium]
MANEREKTVSKTKRSDNLIPDYDYLFAQNKTTKGNNKKGFLKTILGINKRPIALSMFIYIIQSIPTWLTPLLTANIINVVTDFLVHGTLSEQFVIKSIIINTLIILVFLCINVPATILRFRVVSKMHRRTSAGIKSAVVRKLQSLSITYHKDMQSGKIQSKFLKDTESIDGLFYNLMHGIFPQIISIVISTLISILSNEKGWIISIFFAVVIPINVLLTRFFRNKIRITNRDYRVKTENLSAKMNTMLEMMPVTKSHGLEKTEIFQLKDLIAKLSGSGFRVDMITAKFGSCVWVVNSALSTFCVVFCSILAFNNLIGVGDIVLYQSMFTQISGSVMALTNLVPTIATGAEALASVSEIMNATDVEVNTGKRSLSTIDGTVKFEKVCYRYPDGEQDVVHDFSLDVKKGECIAVVGASGSGKSTLMNLIIGFVLPTKGELAIDGNDINDLNLSEYRHNISVVPQNSILFSGSIRENITYGLDKYTEEQLNKVIEMANLNEFLKELPDGLETDVGEHGAKLSGGQKQRITIARALIRDPKILILDEATSALDNISEYHVQKAIASSIKGRTTFIVAHRLSTIRDADRIVVMEQGNMVECGTFEELMAKKGKFYELKALNEINLKKAEEGLA